jgi:hypothetical protein
MVYREQAFAQESSQRYETIDMPSPSIMMLMCAVPMPTFPQRYLQMAVRLLETIHCGSDAALNMYLGEYVHPSRHFGRRRDDALT